MNESIEQKIKRARKEMEEARKEEKIIGILGGMGPYATVDIFKKIIELTPAKKDWNHLRIIIDENPKIPSREIAVLFNGDNPLPEMIKTINNLEKAGADFAIIPSNSAHYWYDDIVKNTNIPIISMIEETAKEVIKKIPDIRKIGLLTTEIILKEKLFHKTFSKYNLEIVTPSGEEQILVREVIEDVKLDKKDETVKTKIKKIINKLISKYKVEGIILGCTELPIILKQEEISVPLFDCNEILAKSAIKYATGVKN